MSTTPHATAVTSDRPTAAPTRPLDGLVADLAGDLNDMILQPRRIHLKHRAPAEKSHHQNRRDIACGKAKPFEMLLRIALNDLMDGAPASAVRRPFEALLALIDQEAERIETERGGASLAAAMLRETRAQGKLDEAQMALQANPDCPDALATAALAADRYEVTLKAMKKAINEKRAQHMRRPALAVN